MHLTLKSTPISGFLFTEKAAAERQADIYNKYAQYKKEDPRTALNRIQQDVFVAKQEIGRLAGDNERAKKYVTQGEGLGRNAKLVSAFTSTDSNLGSLAEFNDGYFVNMGKNGEFAFRPVEEMSPASVVKYDPNDYNMQFGSHEASRYFRQDTDRGNYICKPKINCS
jgi:hypothetical protein